MNGAAVAAAIELIERLEAAPDRLNAFLCWRGADAVAEAAAAEARGARLAGLPVAIKDNICTLDLPTTCGSRLLEGYVSPFEATAVRRLRAAGAVVVGKTNLDEFAMGSSTEYSAFGPTLNPHDRARVAGGSSGGSAAAVAAGAVRVALGSETGGSVRQPAAFCGVTGIKPSYGRVSRYGLVAFASSLDQIGVFGATVVEAAAVLEVIAGADPLDATCADRAVPALGAEAGRTAAGLRVGLPAEYLPDELDAGIRAVVREAAGALRDEGATVCDVTLPHTPLAVPAYYVIATAEASSNLARFDGVRYGRRVAGGDTIELYERTRSAGFGDEVKRRIMLGTYVLSAGYYDAYYARAQRVRARITQDFRRVFDSGVDVLLTPTTPTPAFRVGEKTGDPYEMYMSDVFTVTANLAGLPAASVPAGRVAGLPVGVQLIADRWNEAAVVRAAAAIERALGVR